MKVVSGSASAALGGQLARELGADLIGVATEKHRGGFPDGERYARLLGSVAGEEVVLIQSTHPDEKILELFLLHDAAVEAGATRLTLVIPYFGYARQDRKFLAGEPVSARALAKRLQVQADGVLTVNIHDVAILRFFDVPAQDVDGTPALSRHLKGRGVDLILAPDEKAQRIAREVAGDLGVEWDFLQKKRIDSFTVETRPKALAVRGRAVAIVDDVISTGTTVAVAAKMLREQGADRILVACIHGLFAANALTRLQECDEVIATDTLEGPATKASVAPELVAAIR